MPTQRGSETLCDLIDHAVEVAAQFRRTVSRVIADGKVTPDEQRLVDIAGIEHEQAVNELPGRASDIDGAMQAIGAIAGAGRVSDHAYRVTREVYQDAQRLASVA